MLGFFGDAFFCLSVCLFVLAFLCVGFFFFSFLWVLLVLWYRYLFRQWSNDLIIPLKISQAH